MAVIKRSHIGAIAHYLTQMLVKTLRVVMAYGYTSRPIKNLCLWFLAWQTVCAYHVNVELWAW